MIEVLSKPADQINIHDIQRLIELEVPEGEQIEFKETLPAKGPTGDPWMNGRDSIGDRAKTGILEEVVAFSNAHGGVLVLGVRESDTKPAVASGILPIPRCAELAKRLELVFRDCVEPQLSQIEVIAVPMNGDDGVVLCRVNRSRLAPHRVTTTRLCPVRRSDRCEAMTMREIQDMTLNVSRGLEWLGRRLAARAELFQRQFERLHTPEDAFGVRLTGAPVGDDVRMDRVFRDGRLAREFDEPWHTVVQRYKSSPERRLAGHFDIPVYWQPRLRAARAELQYDTKRYRDGYRELHCDGLIELGFVSVREAYDKEVPLPADLPVEAFANLLVWADCVRRQAQAPTAEYALDVEIISTSDRTISVGTHVSPQPWRLDLESTRFPSYSLADSEEIPRLVNLFWRDFWNAVGQDIGAEAGTLSMTDWPNPQ
ncbi:MAG: ATP-binding protein [Deltaproteobacteria bacterium]|nr:ATP-binding protein [Deltaproteobacteria bacterium]